MADQDQRLFLATGRLKVTHYGGGDTEYEVIRLVRGKDHTEAKLKFDHYYQSRTVEYSVYYSMVESDVSEVIE